MKLRKNDPVIIKSGKDKGRKGTILATDIHRNLVVVKDLNIHHRHLKAQEAEEKSKILAFPAPLTASKVAFLCPQCQKATKIKIRNGARFCAQCAQDLNTILTKENN